jgi:hypothetical protein
MLRAHAPLDAEQFSGCSHRHHFAGRQTANGQKPSFMASTAEMTGQTPVTVI